MGVRAANARRAAFVAAALGPPPPFGVFFGTLLGVFGAWVVFCGSFSAFSFFSGRSGSVGSLCSLRAAPVCFGRYRRCALVARFPSFFFRFRGGLLVFLSGCGGRLCPSCRCPGWRRLCRARQFRLGPCSVCAAGGGGLVGAFAGFSSVGVAGARSGVGAAAAGQLAAAAAAAGAVVFTTCGRGAPAAAAGVPGARVWRVSSPQFTPLPVRARFAARASAFVRALAAAPAPVLLAWPSCPAPAGLRAGLRSWQSCGSGTWSEVALAFGLGVPVVVFGQQPPPSFGPAVSFLGGWLVQPPPSLF